MDVADIVNLAIQHLYQVQALCQNVLMVVQLKV
jgi:hypothetical protein